MSCISPITFFTITIANTSPQVSFSLKFLLKHCFSIYSFMPLSSPCCLLFSISFSRLPLYFSQFFLWNMLPSTNPPEHFDLSTFISFLFLSNLEFKLTPGFSQLPPAFLNRFLLPPFFCFKSSLLAKAIFPAPNPLCCY